METLIQGQVISREGNKYSIQLSSQEVRHLWATPQTVNNGLAKIGDHVVSMVNEHHQALVMTRFMYSQP